jgi:hypothetical protein
MTFDLENAVQQGFNRDTETNDWNVEAHNLEIVLGDRSGGTTFKIKDIDGIDVATVDSDGYLSILGDGEIHGGHLLVAAPSGSQVNSEFITLQDIVDEASIFLLDANPDGSIVGAKGSLGLCYTDGYLYGNADGATDWRRVAYNHEVSDVTLHRAYQNDPDGSGATITTDGEDGAVIIAGSEKLQITATGGLDLDAGFDMDATGAGFTVDLTSGAFSVDADQDSNITITNSNIIFQTITSGDIINRLPATGGDFIIDEGAGIDYLRAETDSSELRLGNIDSGTGVDVRVLSNMTVDGDLTVEGTTTTVNTEDLYVEDRLVRLNVNASSSFNGTVGIEAEVGSDGYVEFHWDDNQGRWEISIDRNTSPESQTFRPLPYLADSPATLDLSNTGNDGWPTDGPNPSAGASVINTNLTNFPYTFGPDMADDSVQSALEAIDGYFLDITYDIVTHIEDVTNPHGVTFTQAVAADSLTDISAAEAETLTDGSNADSLHSHAAIPYAHTHDHGADLTGLGDDDHPQYLLANGTRALTAPWDSQNEITVTALEILTVNADGYVFLHDIGASGTPNITSGAHAIGTNPDNFINTFGPDMTSNSVQAALEAIDGYLESIATGDINVTLHSAYKKDPDGSDAIITTDASDGAVVIAGTEKLQVTATGGLDVDTLIDFDGTTFSADASGAISLDAGAASNFTTSSGTLTIDGAGGVILDGSGNNVIPATSCQDSLGDSTHGWTELYLCTGATVIGLGDAGASSTPNITSGASLVGTDADNFATYGPTMTGDTVQAALEAIDGYLESILDGDVEFDPFTQVRGLDINGAVLNGVVKVSTDAGTPALDFRKNNTSRASWSIPVPADWDGESDMVVEVVWSPATSGAGNIAWRLEYKALTLTELVSSAASTADYTQAAGGTADAVQTTGVELIIPGSAITTSDELIVINIVRRGSVGADTYNDLAQVHLVKYSYVASNIV